MTLYIYMSIIKIESEQHVSSIWTVWKTPLFIDLYYTYRYGQRIFLYGFSYPIIKENKMSLLYEPFP